MQAVSLTSSLTHRSLSGFRALTKNRAEVEEREWLEHNSKGGRVQPHTKKQQACTHTPSEVIAVLTDWLRGGGAIECAATFLLHQVEPLSRQRKSR